MDPQLQDLRALNRSVAKLEQLKPLVTALHKGKTKWIKQVREAQTFSVALLLLVSFSGGIILSIKGWVPFWVVFMTGLGFWWLDTYQRINCLYTYGETLFKLERNLKEEASPVVELENKRIAGIIVDGELHYLITARQVVQQANLILTRENLYQNWYLKMAVNLFGV